MTIFLQAVLALDFHPTFSVLASGSNDCTIKFFDYSKPSVKRSYRAVQEVASVKTLAFHPSGDYMLVGTEQPTCECFGGVAVVVGGADCVGVVGEGQLSEP